MPSSVPSLAALFRQQTQRLRDEENDDGRTEAKYVGWKRTS